MEVEVTKNQPRNEEIGERREEREEKENGAEKGFIEIIAKPFPSWMKDINLQTQEG